MKDLKTELKKVLGSQAVLEGDGKKDDIIVKSKDRDQAKKLVEAFFKKGKITYKSTFKKSKSSSTEVLEVDGFKDIIFKPIIQKGAGGVAFEDELKKDLELFYGGEDLSKLRHKDVIVEMQKVIKISAKDKCEVKAEGSKNQRRVLAYSSGRLTVSNSTGETLTDLTLLCGSDKTYLSLKMSNTYYILSASIFLFFLNPATASSINEYFGFNGQKMGGFGKEYVCLTKPANYSRARNNLQDLLSQAYGRGVIVIHKKRDNDVLVSDVQNGADVIISGLTENSYVYPEEGVRKYANIKVDAKINGHGYKINFQFRGTTAADRGPKYLRILLERL